MSTKITTNSTAQEVRSSEKNFIAKGGRILGRVRLDKESLESLHKIKAMLGLKSMQAAIRHSIKSCGSHAQEIQPNNFL